MRAFTPARSAFHRAEAGDAESTWSKEVVPVGTRCRVRGIWRGKYDVILDSLKGTCVDFMNGDVDDDVLIKLMPSDYNSSFGVNLGAGGFSDMIDFPDLGVLFDNGLTLKIDFSPTGHTASTAGKFLVNVIYSQ